MTLNEWKDKCSKMGFTAQEIADISGISVEIVRATIWGTHIPRYQLWKQLDKALKEASWNIIREEAPAYNVKYEDRLYDIQDYYEIPEGIRVELIDGVIYDMAAPTLVHQFLLTEIATIFKNYIAEHHGNCMPFVAPTDVKPDDDNRTMLQPDFFVVCDRNKLKNMNYVNGAPDFVLEILSSSTRGKDTGIKMRKYKNMGVREYWVVDPEKKQIIVYDFANTTIPRIHDDNSKVPVSIWDGQCEVDFEEMFLRIEFLSES